MLHESILPISLLPFDLRDQPSCPPVVSNPDVNIPAHQMMELRVCALGRACPYFASACFPSEPGSIYKQQTRQALVAVSLVSGPSADRAVVACNSNSRRTLRG